MSSECDNISLRGTALDGNALEIGTPVIGASRLVSCESAILKSGDQRNSPKALDVLDDFVSDSGSPQGPGYEDVELGSMFRGNTPQLERNPVMGESKVLSCTAAILKHGQARNSPKALDVLDECAQISGDPSQQQRSFKKNQEGPGYEDVELGSMFRGNTPQLERNPVIGESKVVSCTHDVLKHGRQTNKAGALDNLDVNANIARGVSE